MFSPPIRAVSPLGSIMEGYYAAENAQNELSKSRLENAKKELENKYYAPSQQADINYRNAMTGRIPLENQMLRENIAQQNILNKFLPESEKARIASQNALSNYRLAGGANMGVGGKDEFLFQNEVRRDNPKLTPEQVYEASNVLRNGGNQLSDGTMLNPLSPAASTTLDRLNKGRTTSALINQGVKANQAEAELQVLNNYAQKGLEPYGTTYNGMSPQQVVDSFKSDEDSQKRLGRLIGAQALGYEAAQNRVRLANGQPGVTTTEELMKISGQQINTKWPKLSYTARKEAADYLDKALEEGLAARNRVGVSAGQLFGNNVDLTNPKEAEKVRKNINTKFQPPAKSGYSQEDLEYTAKKNGMTIEQVKKLLGE